MAGSIMEALQAANLATPQMVKEARQREENRQLWAKGKQKSLVAKSNKEGKQCQKKKSYKPIAGICYECQRSQEIRPNPEYSEYDEHGHHKLNDPEDHYVLAEHETCGSRCSGSGQVPEKLIWEKK